MKVISEKSDGMENCEAGSRKVFPRWCICLKHQRTLVWIFTGFGGILVYFLLTCANCLRDVPRKTLEVYHLEKEAPFLVEYFVDINRAEIPELMLLPGVGEVTATKIIQERQTNGLFQSVEDLDRVPGIGAKKIQALEAYVLPTHGPGMMAERESLDKNAI
ncbi:MAG: ComEA family DNA-binding protein [Planctomycetia bacterium]|nr:ComEA family DNA-binding protein [Planctomycetia bacterium]